ncbi:hypothetical protein DSC45_06295 [Streptomyces sp. YIM 130001]|uniref:DUF937 domain-containing protein n=1 Tax=Streptomyces sp. YIM 130001 TaxID=2259644 RepID=UPI000E6513AD|nr:DUF937 domain-containing protein [Streptomyces sp. YIM 130001]RII19605.1 hypothetical protein DSC45_06295 [Streptomyces sp. YIM 130001]
MSDHSSEEPAEPARLETDVLQELGDDRLGEIAEVLGTDRGGAEDVVRTTVSALSGGLQEKAAGPPEEADEVRQALDETAETPESAEPPLQGVSTLGGFGGGLGGLLGGGMMAGVLAKVSKPVATAVAKRTGLPVPAVTRAIELMIPVVLAVLSKRTKSAKTGPRASGGSPDLGDLLGSVLGRRPK